VEPRSVKHKNKLRKQRKRWFRTFTSSVAISSLLLGTARMTGPTYGAFTSVQDQEIGVQACFIFPKEVEKRRDLTYEWKEEAIALMEDILAKASEIDVAGLTEKIEGMINPEEGKDSAGEAPAEISFDTTTIEGLQAQQESLRAEIAAIQATIAANEQKVADLEAIILEIQELQTKLQDILANEFPKGELKAQENLKKIEETLEFIKSIVKLAIEECNYDPEFFELILTQIEGFKEELTLSMEEFAEGKILTEEQLEQLDMKMEEVNKAMEDLRKQNTDLLAKITEIESTIASIDQQIVAFQEIQKKKDGLKAGAAQLIQKLIDSKNLTEEQVQYLMDKLAEINTALDNKDLTADISGLEQAITDIEKEMSNLEEIQVQKKGLKEGTSLLIQKINESTTLSDEQKQALIDKLTGLNSAIDSGDLSTGTGDFEKALAEIEKEIKQKEEEAKLEQEKLEKEKLEKEQQEQQEEGVDGTQPQAPNPNGIDALIKQITESTTLTDEQKQELLDKLAELDAANGENASGGTTDLEKALSEIEKEMKQKEEAAKAEQEEKEKTEEENKEGEEGTEEKSPEEGKDDPAKEEKPAKEEEKKPEEEKPVKDNEKEQAPNPEPAPVQGQPVKERSDSNDQINKLLNSGAVKPQINNPESPNKNLSVEDARMDMRMEESAVEPE
jgi:DNA repair exonuclease SbcCD ATPase subunit